MLAYIDVYRRQKASLLNPWEQITSQSKEEADGLVALLYAIVDSSEDAIVSKTLDGIVTSWNRSAERIFGYTAEEIIGRSITVIIPPERLEEEEYVLGCLRSGNKVEHFETVRLTKDGRRIDVSLTVSPIKDSTGRIIGASKIARDITERKRLEQERELVHQQLLATLAARDDLIAIAAHELRNPLNVLTLMWQLMGRVLGQPEKADRAKQLFEKSRAQLERLNSLVDRLFDVARVQGGALDLYWEKFDLCELIQQIINRFVVENPDVAISSELEPRIMGTWDRIRVDQVITNLLSNAIKYSNGNPVAVNASTVKGHALVKVRDSGLGIAREDLGRIFDRFARARTAVPNRGLGIGLWITKQIVAAHGGTISAESEVGRGSIFTVRLPLNANGRAP